MGRGLAAAGPGAAPRAVARLEGGAWPEKVPLRLPAGLVNTVRSACWHTSAETRREDQTLEEYEQLARQVTTADEIWRAAITRGLREVTPGIRDWAGALRS